MAGGDWRPGTSLRPARAGLEGRSGTFSPSPPTIPPPHRGDRRDLRGRIKVASCLRPSLPLRPPGQENRRKLSLLGNPLSEGQSALGGEHHKSTTSAKKAAARFLPRPSRERALPGSQGATRGWRSRKEAEGERENGPGASRGGGEGGERAEAVSGNLTRRVLRSASTHQGRHRRAGKEGTLSRTEESQTSLSFSQHFIGGCLTSISSFHPREKTHHPPPPPPKNSTSTTVYLWKKE